MLVISVVPGIELRATDTKTGRMMVPTVQALPRYLRHDKAAQGPDRLKTGQTLPGHPKSLLVEGLEGSRR